MLKIVEKHGASRENPEGQADLKGETGSMAITEDSEPPTERVFPGLVFRVRPQDFGRS